jgi:toxin ParE1/3/4
VSWRLEFKPAALQDLRDIADSISARAGARTVGRRWADKIRSQCQDYARLSSQVGRPRTELAPKLRSVPIGNYMIFLRYNDQALVILAIIHAARDYQPLITKRDDADS